MRKGVHVESDKGYRYAMECRLCLDKWVVDIPALGGQLMEKHLEAHVCASMAEAKRNANGYNYQAFVFGVHSVLWNEDPKGYHPCGPKCESAKGASCHCECRGLKHGIANMPKDPTPELRAERCELCGSTIAECDHPHDWHPSPPVDDGEVAELFRRLGPEGRSDMWAEMHDRKSRRIGKNGI